MFRSRCAALTLVCALVAMPAVAQQAPREQPQPDAAASPAGTAPGTVTLPRTVINNTFNPTGPTGTGTFSPTAEFVVCVNEGGDARVERSTGLTGMMSGSARHVEGRIAFLKAELKITDAQLPLWNALAGAMRDHARSMATRSGETTATLPGRLAALDKAMAARLDTLHKLQAAVAPLYAALADEQKKVADELTADMGDDTMRGGAQGRCR